MSSPSDAISAISSAVGVFLDVFGIALFFLPGGYPGRNQMVVFALGVMPDPEDDRAESAAAPSDRAKLLRVVTLPVNQVHLVEDLLRLFQADAVLSFDFPAFLRVEVEAHCLYNCYIILTR